MEGLRNGKNVFVTTKKAIFCANNPFFGVERQGKLDIFYLEKLYIHESCDFPPFVTTQNIRKGFVTAKSLFSYNKKRISLYFFYIKTRFWLLRSLPCYFGLLQMGANHNFHKCTTFPEKKCQVIPVLRSQKVGFCHKKLLFLLLQTHLYRYGALPCYFMPLRVGQTSFGTQTTPSPP